MKTLSKGTIMPFFLLVWYERRILAMDFAPPTPYNCFAKGDLNSHSGFRSGRFQVSVRVDFRFPFGWIFGLPTLISAHSGVARRIPPTATGRPAAEPICRAGRGNPAPEEEYVPTAAVSSSLWASPGPSRR